MRHIWVEISVTHEGSSGHSTGVQAWAVGAVAPVHYKRQADIYRQTCMKVATACLSRMKSVTSGRWKKHPLPTAHSDQPLKTRCLADVVRSFLLHKRTAFPSQ